MIELYTFGTPNGQKASIMLEEAELAYQTHIVDITKGDQLKPEFLAINPNNKIPAIVDSDGPGGAPITLFESGAILLYLAEKTGKLLPKDAAKRHHAVQWLMFQMGGVGPMLGQANHFVLYAKEKIPYAIQRYSDESRRILGVLDKQLGKNEYIAGEEYSVADIATFPWVQAVYGKPDPYASLVEGYDNLKRWHETVGKRGAVQRGMKVPDLSKK